MDRVAGFRLGWTRRPSARGAELQVGSVQPFGVYGGGLLTEHPVGLLVVTGIVLVAVLVLPEARWFVAGAAALGACAGLLRWIRHR